MCVHKKIAAMMKLQDWYFKVMEDKGNKEISVLKDSPNIVKE